MSEVSDARVGLSTLTTSRLYALDWPLTVPRRPSQSFSARSTNPQLS